MSYKQAPRSMALKTLIGKQKNLPEALKEKILAAPESVAKQTKNFSKKIEKMPTEKSPSFIDNVKSYLKGEQGLIPDIKGKPTRQAMNESTFFNPKTGSEIMSDQMDARMYSSYLDEEIKADKQGKNVSPGVQRSLDFYSARSKKIRPNRKDRY